MSKPEQLSLSVALNDETTFENFYTAGAITQQQVVSILQNDFLYAREPFVYVWGASGSGVTHLLQATCHQALSLGKSVQYLPLNILQAYPPQELFYGLEELDIVCLDGIDVIVGIGTWEQALFDLFNRIRESGGCLLLGAHRSPRDLGVQLPDLQSRLSWGLTFVLDAFDDRDKVELLKFRAAQRGLDMSENTCRYMLNHTSRDMKNLMASLDALDKGSLREQRKLTIPFIKQVLNLSV